MTSSLWVTSYIPTVQAEPIGNVRSVTILVNGLSAADSVEKNYGDLAGGRCSGRWVLIHHSRENPEQPRKLP